MSAQKKAPVDDDDRGPGENDERAFAPVASLIIGSLTIEIEELREKLLEHTNESRAG